MDGREAAQDHAAILIHEERAALAAEAHHRGRGGVGAEGHRGGAHVRPGLARAGQDGLGGERARVGRRGDDPAIALEPLGDLRLEGEDDARRRHEQDHRACDHAHHEVQPEDERAKRHARASSGGSVPAGRGRAPESPGRGRCRWPIHGLADLRLLLLRGPARLAVLGRALVGLEGPGQIVEARTHHAHVEPRAPVVAKRCGAGERLLGAREIVLLVGEPPERAPEGAASAPRRPAPCSAPRRSRPAVRPASPG